jgi:hypothetical protein
MAVPNLIETAPSGVTRRGLIGLALFFAHKVHPDTIADISLHPGTICSLRKRAQKCSVLLTSANGSDLILPWGPFGFGQENRSGA